MDRALRGHGLPRRVYADRTPAWNRLMDEVPVTHLTEYPRASMQAANARLKVSDGP